MASEFQYSKTSPSSASYETHFTTSSIYENQARSVSTVSINSSRNSTLRSDIPSIHQYPKDQDRDDKMQDGLIFIDKKSRGKQGAEEGQRSTPLTQKHSQRSYRLPCLLPGCGTAFSRKYELDRHLKSVHTPLLLRRCPHCPPPDDTLMRTTQETRTEDPAADMFQFQPAASLEDDTLLGMAWTSDSPTSKQQYDGCAASPIIVEEQGPTYIHVGRSLFSI